MKINMKFIIVLLVSILTVVPSGVFSNENEVFSEYKCCAKYVKGVNARLDTGDLYCCVGINDDEGLFTGNYRPGIRLHGVCE